MSQISTKKKNIKMLTGVVTSNKMDLTVKVLVEVPIKHPVYRKVVTRRKTYFARTELELEVGDKVVIKESKPISKNVRWVVVEKVD